uniref:Kinase n=1 Tax=Triatoma infestans TaxID=30076 RepID=A0A023F7W5_TRIIF
MEENGPNFLPFGLMKFDNQVAGHSAKDGKSLSGLLKSVDGFVLKPLTKFPAGDIEVKFYEDLKHRDDVGLLREFIPEYFGTLVLRIHDIDVKFLKLQDVTVGLKKPCIMDIKLGAQTWEPSAPYYKREAEEKKYSATKRAYGFCIPGYQVYDLCSGKFKKVGKEEGKLLTKETLPQALKEFFNYDSGYSKFLVGCFLQHVIKLLSWWEKQTIYHFYSSSLLFLYDAFMLKEINRNEICESTLPWIKLYCIDFAHVVPANNTLDFNYISGLTKLVDLLKSINDC